MEQGYSIREAARIAGSHLRTGRRWRNDWHSPPGGRKAVPPIYPLPGGDPLRSRRNRLRPRVTCVSATASTSRTVSGRRLPFGRWPSAAPQPFHHQP
nr:hypothetical protein [Streptomyces anulatus]